MSVLIKNMEKADRCCLCPLCRYSWEDGKVMCSACDEIVAEIPYKDRLLDSALDSIKAPDFCPVIEISADLENLVDIDEVEAMLDDAAIISDGEYGGYCTEDVKLSQITRIAEKRSLS